MTLTLEIPSEIERAAAASQTDVSTFLVTAGLEKAATLSPQQNRRAAVEAAHGCARTEAWLDDLMMADFNAGKREDIERENARDLI